MAKNNLKEILTEYENTLCDRTFKYVLSNNSEIRIVFYRENFCHLIGLQYLYKNDKHYLGRSGYESIKQDKINIEKMKLHSDKDYNYIKYRIRYIKQLPNLLRQGDVIKFYVDRCYPQSNIVADFIIVHKNKHYKLHLFLKQEKKGSTQYVPVSFIVKSDNDKNQNQYTERQEHKKVKDFTIIT